MSELARERGVPEAASIPSKVGQAGVELFRVFSGSRLALFGVLGCVLFVGFAVIAPFFAPDPLHQTDALMRAPSGDHLFGTDHVGRDLLSRVASGSRVSLLVAVFAVLLGLILAVPIGMLAGYRGGTWVDELIMRFVDVLLSLPLFVLAMFVLGIFGSGTSDFGPISVSPAAKIIFLIGISAMPFFARVARSATLVEMHEDYVNVLRTVGVSERRILFREVLVNVLPPISVQAFLWMAIAIFSEAALSFLGLGIQPPDPTLGTILFDATTYIFGGAWWYSLFPGLMLLLATVGFNLVGDGLNDYLDPQVRQ